MTLFEQHFQLEKQITRLESLNEDDLERVKKIQTYHQEISFFEFQIKDGDEDSNEQILEHFEEKEQRRIYKIARTGP